MNINHLRLMAPILLLFLPIAAYAAGTQAKSTRAQSDNLEIHLGDITVHGERKIIATLQAIKVALNQPESSDPKLANTVVCRLHNQIGSHEQQILTCATNLSLAARRDATELSMREALSNPTGPGSTDSAVSELNEMLADQPGNMLHAPVNGPAFRALLEKIPLPAKHPTAPPAASTHP